MLTRLTKAWRLRSAGMLAVLYLLCVLAPAAAFAAGDAARNAHCLTDTKAHVHQSTSAASHTHEPGASDHGDDHDEGTAAAGTQCCMLFCVTSLPAPAVDIASAAVPGSVDLVLTEQTVTGRGTDGPFRPPRPSLSN